MGTLLFAAAMMAFGLECLILSQPILGLEPLPKNLPAPTVWAVLTGILVLSAGIGLTFRRSVHLSAAILAILFCLLGVLLHVPGLIASLTDGSRWTCFFEVVALGGAMILLTAHRTETSDPQAPAAFKRFGEVAGRLSYGISLPAFGVLHLIYPQYIAHGVPAWIPFRLFWAYFVAAAFFAAGAGIVSRVKATSAAFWTGVMFLSWVLIVHLPRVLDAMHSQTEWTAMFVPLAMGGGAWIVAGSVADRPMGTLRAPFTVNTPVER